MASSSHESRITSHVRWLLLLSLAEIATMLTFANYPAALPVLPQEWSLTAAGHLPRVGSSIADG